MIKMERNKIKHIKCKKCGYIGETVSTDDNKTKIGFTKKYVCPVSKCRSNNIEYVSREIIGSKKND